MAFYRMPLWDMAAYLENHVILEIPAQPASLKGYNKHFQLKRLKILHIIIF